MKMVVVYDSVFGNTEQIARTMGAALATAGEVQVLRVGAVSAAHLAEADLLLVGSPTRGFAATPASMAWLTGLPADALQGVRAAVFDTRMDVRKMNFIARLIVDKGGYAAKPMAELLKAKGAQIVAEPTGFFVKDREGPLSTGELERAAAWAKACLN